MRYHRGMKNSASALLLFAHGSSDPGWAAPFVKLKSMIEARDPTRMVALAYLERMSPSFDSAVDELRERGATAITIAPIFLALGGHMRKDLPSLIEATAQRTGVVFDVLPALGEADALLEAIAGWVLVAAER